MRTVIVDYGSGNLRSAEKSFARMAEALDAGTVSVSDRPEEVASADRIVLPGVGAFADCREGLRSRDGLWEAIEEAVRVRGRPFFGICVGMQLLASRGTEHGVTAEGFGWIPGEVVGITPSDPALKIPHMGWNTLEITRPHPVLNGIAPGRHVYFVHSYHLVPERAAHLLATTDHGGPITAAVGQDNIFGTQFHPEKSQKVGLAIIGNFLRWRP